MSKTTWTPDQQNAINHRGSSLLVSAAAGSGKTAVLVERLLGFITRENRDITDFLIITYTKAAAGELRKKISRALHEKIAETPDDRHLRRQLALAGSARISTVHSFCSWLLKNYGNFEGLSSLSRILDESEEELILKDILTELIEEMYESKDPSFLALADYMNDGRSDRLLFSSVIELYKKSRSHPYPEKWLQASCDAYNTAKISSVSETVWGQAVMRDATEILNSSRLALETLLHDAQQYADTSELYSEPLAVATVKILECFSEDWNTLFEKTSSFELERLPSSRKIEDKTIPEKVGALYKVVKEDIKSIPEKLMLAESEVLLKEAELLYPIITSLCALTSELSERFEAEKLRRGVLDYSDLEHFCIRLLISDYDEENDTVIPSETAKEVSASFTEILLDEFQDSNIIQDIIFRSVSRDEKNIVMVGDVKQSIYGFRLADPSIFMKKYKTFKKYDEAKGDEARVITLSRNFRSRREILDTSNSLFKRIMTENLGGVDYTEDHFLVARDDIPDMHGMKTEFCLIDYVKGEEKGVDAEARFTANKIAELVNGGFEITDKDSGKRPCRYSDFAVLLRSTSTAAESYERELARLGIPFSSPKPDALLEKSEVSAIVSLLSVIDNPTSDIPLIAALKSPMFAFSADDLCEIRKERGSSFISSMKSLAGKNSEAAKKCRDFLELLRTLRSLSRGMSASELIWEIYNRTNALGMFGALSYGRERQKNLLAFYKCAEDFESLGYCGLYKFISHIAKLIENGGDIVVPKSFSQNSVTIMTMHKSKGLEFPIVFVGNVIRSFNLEDIKNPILIHPKLGIGTKFKDDENALFCTTVMRESIRRRILADQKSEEMRLLYVALTRAREKMFITASRDNAKKKLFDFAFKNPYSALDSSNLTRRNDAALWFLIPLLRTTAGESLFSYGGVELSGGENDFDIDAYVVPSDEIASYKEAAENLEQENENAESATLPTFVYPHSLATKTPSKLTATKLGAKSRGDAVITHKKPMRPRFIREKTLSPAERGTALHMAMQFVDFSKCASIDGIERELSRLYDEKFLTKAQVESISPERIHAFLTSDIGKAMESADKVYREFKFSVLLPADELLENSALSGDDILLQGVIDMYFEKDGEITIVDFKTDRNRPSGEVLEKYKAQVLAYRRALFEMTGKNASKAVLYLATCDDFIEVI